MPNKMEGIGLYSYEILRRIVKSHPEHQFIFCFDRPFDSRFIFSHNVEAVVISPPARHALLFLWWYQVGIPYIYKNKSADLFFSPDGFLSLSSTVQKSLVTIHDLAYLSYPKQISRTNLWYYRYFMPRHIRKANHIITVSQSTKTDLINHFPAAADKSTVVYNGTRDIFKPIVEEKQRKICERYTSGQPYFISIGALHPRKNTARLIRAFTRLREKTAIPVHLLIVGRLAWQTAEIQETFRDSSHKSSIHFLDYVTDHDLTDLLASSLALVYISLFEGFGLPIVEAMRAGIPVIASNQSSMAEIAGEDALLVDPHSVPDIVKGMDSILHSPKLRSTLKKKGLKRATQFDWDKSAAQTFDIMSQLGSAF
jgi:glycosyltransferase involved in cell wall biosynthesis